MRDVQRGAVVVAGVVLQDDHRAGAALLGAYVGVEVGKIHVAPAVNPVFLHAVSPFLSFVSFDIPQSEKAGHVRISLAVVFVLFQPFDHTGWVTKNLRVYIIELIFIFNGFFGILA